jgi:hypothetical protein
MRGQISFLRLNYGDDGRSQMILDAAGNIYVAACTQSIDFPTTSGFFSRWRAVPPIILRRHGMTQDGVVLKLNPNLSA